MRTSKSELELSRSSGRECGVKKQLDVLLLTNLLNIVRRRPSFRLIVAPELSVEEQHVYKRCC